MIESENRCTAAELPLTGQQRVDRAALEHGWISNGGDVDDVGLYSYRRPGAASFVSVTYANGIILWADGMTAAPGSADTSMASAKSTDSNHSSLSDPIQGPGILNDRQAVATATH